MIQADWKYRKDLDSLKQYERVFNIFDGNSETAVNAARTFWKELKGAGEEIYYWQQEDNGRWKQKAWATGENISAILIKIS